MEIAYPVWKLSDNMWYDVEDNGQIVAQDPRTGHSSMLLPYDGTKDTLAVKRLRYMSDKLHKTKMPLTTLNKGYEHRTDQVLFGKSGRYIDSMGYMFNWHKTKFIPIKAYPMKKIDTKPNGVSVIQLIGLDKFIITRYLPPSKKHNYVLLAMLDNGPLMYGYSTYFGMKKRIKV